MIKRIFDITLAAFGAAAFFPLALVFAALIKAEDGGPVFYVQSRWGRGGRKFLAYKFRTMVPNADQKEGFRPAGRGDTRVTRIGKLLRATAMDELPQLFNILKGEMSFVGPRALAVDELDPKFPFFEERHSVVPGLTGPAQVRAPKEADLRQKFEYDLEYIRNRSFLQDLTLILLSIGITLRARWESPKKKI